MLYVVTYDVVDHRRRALLAKRLLDFGSRVQYSVFECLMEQRELDEMLGSIRAIVDVGEDSVRVYCLCAACETRVTIVGTGARTEDPPVYIV